MKSNDFDKEHPEKDLGLQDTAQINLNGMHRLINHDGTFNIVKKGLSKAFLHNFYHDLIAMRWLHFGSIVVSMFIVLILLFSVVYSFFAEMNTKGFLDAFFFSAQTLTTADLGCEPLPGVAVRFIAIVESLMGILLFAIVTGICYARFAKPDAKILFSKNILVAPHKNITALHMKTCNLRKSQLIDTEANIIFSFWKTVDGKRIRKYEVLALESEKVNLFPLPWIIVHPIDESSPLWGLKEEALALMDAEFIVLIKSYDDSFSQSVNLISSYKHQDLVWGAKFRNNYERVVDHKIVIEMDKMDEYDRVPLP